MQAVAPKTGSAKVRPAGMTQSVWCGTTSQRRVRCAPTSTVVWNRLALWCLLAYRLVVRQRLRQAVVHQDDAELILPGIGG
jgi:hypothetical protein